MNVRGLPHASSRRGHEEKISVRWDVVEVESHLREERWDAVERTIESMSRRSVQSTGRESDASLYSEDVSKLTAAGASRTRTV